MMYLYPYTAQINEMLDPAAVSVEGRSMCGDRLVRQYRSHEN